MSKLGGFKYLGKKPNCPEAIVPTRREVHYRKAMLEVAELLEKIWSLERGKTIGATDHGVVVIDIPEMIRISAGVE